MNYQRYHRSLRGGGGYRRYRGAVTGDGGAVEDTMGL